MDRQKIPTVLVVDDDADCVRMMCRAIGTIYPVTFAVDGEEALRKARVVMPDVIILDIMMPGGMDGFATFCNLRRDPRTCNIPVIMVSEVCRKTGLPFSGESMKQYLGAVPTAFIEKPVASEQLLREVENVLAYEHGVRDRNAETDNGNRPYEQCRTLKNAGWFDRFVGISGRR